MREDKGTVIAAWAESASGPGWANSPLWYLVRGRNGDLSVECLQPDEQTADMLMLYSISCSVSGLMRTLVVREVEDD